MNDRGITSAVDVLCDYGQANDSLGSWKRNCQICYWNVRIVRRRSSCLTFPQSKIIQKEQSMKNNCSVESVSKFLRNMAKTMVQWNYPSWSDT